MKNYIYDLSTMFENQDEIDFYSILLLLIINIFLWKVNTKHWISYLLSFIIFGIILPDWSCSREVQRAVAKNTGPLDSFNLWYALLVYPKYWFALIMQILYLVLKPKILKSDLEKINKNILDRNLD